MEHQQDPPTSQHEFCHPGNIDAAVAYLSQELTLAGLPGVAVAGGPGDRHRLDTVALVNVAWRLLRNARDGLASQQEMQRRLARAEADRLQLETGLARSREQYAALEGRQAQQQEQQRQLTAQLATGQARLSEAKDELRRLQSLLQQRTAHCQHELKKQERQAERLKDMTHRLLDRERRGGGGGRERHALVISGLLGRSDGSRARWRTPAAADRAREEAYERVLAGCEARQLRLLEESQRLRGLLGDLLRAVMEASGQTPCAEHCPPCDGPALLDSLDLGLPYDRLADPLDTLVACQLRRLAQSTGERRPAGPELEQLRRQLEEAEQLVLEQRLLIEAGNTDGGGCDDSFLRDAFLVEERAELALRQRQLEEQRQALAHERHIYTEAVLRLGRERLAFDSERAELSKRQFLASSPAPLRRPASARSSPGDVIKGNRQLLSPSDAARPRQASPRVSPGTPSLGRRGGSASPDPYLSELGLPASLYKPEPRTPNQLTDRSPRDHEKPDP